MYDIVDAYDVDFKVERVIECYDFDEIISEQQDSNFVEQHKDELVKLWRDMTRNLKVIYDD